MSRTDDDQDRDDPLESDMDSTDEWEPDEDEPPRKRAWIIAMTIVIVIFTLIGAVLWR